MWKSTFSNSEKKLNKIKEIESLEQALFSEISELMFDYQFDIDKL